jgi:hypothetical protein
MFQEDIAPAEDELVRQSDPCRRPRPFSLSRFGVFTLLFVTALPGGALILFALDDPYGILLGSQVIDTAAVALYTFAANRNGNQAFLLSCPAVQRALPRLMRRHVAFLAVLFVFDIASLLVRPHLSLYWTTAGKDPSPFAVVITVITACVVIGQVLSNRSILDSAHAHLFSPKGE